MKVLATIKGAILNHKQLRSEAPEHGGSDEAASPMEEIFFLQS